MNKPPVDWKFLLVFLAGTIPAMTVAIGLYAFTNIFIAMFMMHWIGMVLPAVGVSWYNRGRDGLIFYSTYLRQQTVRGDFVTQASLYVTGFAVTVLLYMVDSCKFHTWALCVGKVDENMSRYGFHELPRWLVIVCGAYFSFVNPFLEEMFWRVFMIAETAAQEEGQLDASHPDEESQLVSEGVKLKTKTFPFVKAIVFAMLYSSYHTLVVGALLGGWTYALASFAGISALGLIFHWLIHTFDPKRGFYRSVLLHAGIDLGVVIALADAVGWIHLVYSFEFHSFL